MADLVITAANVVPGIGARVALGTAGATITAGQAVYRDAADSDKFKLADSDNASGAVRNGVGVSLNGAAAGQPLSVVVGGPVTIGAAVAPGVAYYISNTPGGICPVADLGSGDYPVLLGMASSATVIEIDIVNPTAALA